MNEKLLKVLGGKTEFYPKAIEERFPRVFNKILELCETKHLEAYLLDLMVDKRGGSRQGFPQDAAAEIIRLGNFLRLAQPLATKINVWDNVPEYKKIEIERLGFTLSPQGFLKAVDTDHKEAVHVFLSSGIDLEVKDERGWTPLMIAAANGNQAFTLLLIHCGARLVARDVNGFTPLHWAAFSGMSEVIELLISKGADVNSQSQFGWTPLMQVCTRGHVQACSVLITFGADVNLANSEGSTALHIAASKGFIEIVKLLLDRGALRQLVSNSGSTPLMLATKAGHAQIIELLSY